MRTFFGDTHRIQAREDRLSTDMDWVTECMARLFGHSRLYQCSKFHGQAPVEAGRCPGGCGLKASKHKPRMARNKWRRVANEERSRARRS